MSGSGMSGAAPEARHLRALVALTEEGSFTDAAIRLGLTQSAVSRSIGAFERLLGVELVRRTTRSVSLTPAGTRCYRAAVLALSALDDVARAANDAARPLRLGYTWSALGRHTSSVLRLWRAEHPDVPLEVHRVDDRSAGLVQGAADVAVVRGAESLPTMTSRLIFREPRVAALPSTHPLAPRASVTLPDLRADTIVFAVYGTTTPQLWPATDQPRSSRRVDNIDEWLTEIAGGLGVGITAESTAAQHAHPGVSFVPLRDVEPVSVFLAWPERHAHPGVGAFVELVLRVVETPDSPGPDRPTARTG